MIQVEKLSYGFPAKDLYKEVSFNLETGRHCALIGSNGSGKSTLVDMIIHPDQYLYDGKIIKDERCRIGYASQFAVRDKEQECTVYMLDKSRHLLLNFVSQRLNCWLAKKLPSLVQTVQEKLL